MLRGVFSDWRGDHTAGAFLLNPEGFEHAPSTDEGGNEVFVRLRQYPGQARPQVAIDTNAMPWDASGRKVLYAADPSRGWTDTQYLQRWKGGEAPVSLEAPAGGMELFVVRGAFDSVGLLEPGQRERHAEHSWLRLPEGTALELAGAEGERDVVLLVKEGAEPSWRPTPEST